MFENGCQYVMYQSGGGGGGVSAGLTVLKPNRWEKKLNMKVF
jgi:hypothetical protein